MSESAIALLWFGLLILLLAVALWPRVGILAWLRRGRRLSQRVQIEDALKHILNCELADQTATVQSLAGVLEISPAQAHALVTNLGVMKLSQLSDRGLVLTHDGRAYALRILRTHRLLERYFADRTGVPPSDWHDLAESAEHGLSEAEVEALASKMGHPAYDPHGDPIPTKAGQLPPPHGVPLGALAAGDTATVIHVEDEPATVFHRLLSLGVNVAVPVKMIKADPNGIEVLIGGVARRFDPLMASAVTVERVEEGDRHTVLFERLDDLRPGQRAIVVQIAPTVQGPQRRRLLDLGVLPGTDIVAELQSPSGDPMAYRIRGALIALRRPQARGIYIRRAPVAAEVG